MTTNATPRRWFLSPLRYGIPVLIVVLAALAIAGFWLAPDLPLDNRAGSTFFIAGAALALLTLWAVLMSGFRWYVRIAAVLPFAGLVALLAGGYIVFDGDMIPSLRPPWENHDALVEQHRREHAGEGLPPVALSYGPADSPEFRGSRRDGVVEGPNLAPDWSAKPPRMLWRQPCGEGYSSFAIAGNLMVTLEQRRDQEVVAAYDTETGRERWKYEYPARFWEAMGGLGPRATPTISEGEVFSLGALGHLACLDAATGAPKWTVNILEGGENLPWGMAGSPLVIDGKVIVTPGHQGSESAGNRAVIAYDRRNGQVLWATPGKRGAYSSPMLARLDGQRQIVLLDGAQVAGYDLDTGRSLWSYPWDRTQQDINVVQPIVWEDGRVFVSSGYGVGCAMIQVRRSGSDWDVKELWRLDNKPLRCKMSSPVEYNGFIYGLDEGILACIDARDGALRWREGRYGHGQMLRWKDRLVLLDEKGFLVLVEATPQRHNQLGRVKAIRSEPRTWNVPAMANGRIFVRNDLEMAGFDLRE